MQNEKCPNCGYELTRPSEGALSRKVSELQSRLWALEADWHQLHARFVKFETDKAAEVERLQGQISALTAERDGLKKQIEPVDEGDYKACGVCGAPYPWEKSISQATHLKLQAEISALKAERYQAALADVGDNLCVNLMASDLKPETHDAIAEALKGA